MVNGEELPYGKHTYIAIENGPLKQVIYPARKWWIFPLFFVTFPGPQHRVFHTAQGSPLNVGYEKGEVHRK